MWFGLNYDVTDLKVVRAHLSRALTFLDDPQAAREAVQGGEGVDAYLALFTLGMASKVSMLMLPAVLLVLDWQPLDRLTRDRLPRLLAEKLPMLLIGGLAAWMAVRLHNEAGNLQGSPGFFGNSKDSEIAIDNVTVEAVQ